MIRSEILECFLLGFDLQMPNEGRGRPTNITQLQIAACEKCSDCSKEELLDALYNLRTDHAELTKFVGLPTGQFQAVNFNRVRNTQEWSDFFMVRRFNIKTLPAGRRRFEELETANAEDNDRRFARLAIEEACKSISEQDGRPHPKVGAVVVKNSKVLSMAHRGEEPGNHAEFLALERKLSDEAVAGSTVYATLEPCTTRNHPKIPCAERLVERKVARVVIGMLDPDDRISGRGQRRLRRAGIVTDFFPHDLMKEVEEMNREFIRYCEHTDQAKTSSRQVPRADDPKFSAILEYKGKPVTVMNRPRSGRYQGLDSYWPNETIVLDCNQSWVTLKNSGGESSFPLTQVEVNFDNERKRLRLEIDRY